jgi:hypothetical protein
MRFKKGQKVVCVRPTGPFVCNATGLIEDIGPKFNDIVTVAGYSMAHLGNVYISEYLWSDRHRRRRSFREYHFEPIISDAVLAEELAKVREPQILEFDRMLKRVLG